MTFPTAEDFQYVKSNASWGAIFHELSIGIKSEEEYEPLKQQIIQDHIKAEKYDSLMKANSEIVQHNIDITKDHEVVERLKTQIEFQREITPSNYSSTSLLYILKSILENKK